MAKKQSKPRRRNPASTAEVQAVADYPIRAWIDSRTGQQFNTVTLRLEDGRYLSAIDIDPEIRATAPTKEKAERAAISLMVQHRSRKPNPATMTEAEEDAADLALSRSRLHEPRTPLREVMKELGLRIPRKRVAR